MSWKKLLFLICIFNTIAISLGFYFQLNNIEWIDLAGVMVLASGLGFTWHQVRQVAKSHQENHRWNRMIAAQNAIANPVYEPDLVEKFWPLKVGGSVKLNIITDDDDYKELKHKITNVLNYYEFLCNGINEAVYEIDVIKSARKNSFFRYYDNFKEFIEYLRNESGNASLYIQLEQQVNEWRSEDNNIVKKPPIK